jgi:hypothetical protein
MAVVHALDDARSGVNASLPEIGGVGGGEQDLPGAVFDPGGVTGQLGPAFAPIAGDPQSGVFPRGGFEALNFRRAGEAASRRRYGST